MSTAESSEPLPGAEEPIPQFNSQLAARYPALLECAGFLYTTSLLEPTLRDIPELSNRQARRQVTHNQTDALISATIVGASYLHTISDPYERLATAQTTWYHYARERADGVAYSRQLGGQMTLIADTYDMFEHESSTMAMAVVSDMQTGGDNVQYDLLKGLAATRSDTVSDDDILAAETLTAVLIYKRPEVIAQLQEKLQNGAYHGLIANELLEKVQRALTDGDTPPNGMGRLAALMRYSGSFAGETDAAALRRRMSAVVEYWPADCVAVIQQRVGDLQNGLYTRQRAAEAQLAAMHMVGRATTRSDFDLALSKAFDAQVRPRLTKAQIMQNRATHKRARKADKAEQDDIPTADEAAPTTPYRLAKFNQSSGEMIDEDDPGFEALIKEYLGADAHNIVLAEDVQNILQSMREFDFTKHIRGVNKATDSKIHIAHSAFDVFEYKPKMAVGVPTRSERAKGIRVLFVIGDDHTLGVVKIIDRRAINQGRRIGGIVQP